MILPSQWRHGLVCNRERPPTLRCDPLAIQPRSKESRAGSPDGPAHDQFLLDRPGNDEIQLDPFLSYGSNPPLYPAWQSYFRTRQPPMLIAWGTHDQIFPAVGAEPKYATNHH
jgi:hypothetical protein